MADVAALRFSGPALKWFEWLDDDTQRDWKLLRQSIILQYAEPSYEEAAAESTPTKVAETFIFEGESIEEADSLIKPVQKGALDAAKQGDDKWMADLAATCFTGRASRWHSSLDRESVTSWKALEKLLLSSFNAQPGDINAKRIGIMASARKSEERKDGLLNSWNVAWHLVEVGGAIPENAIPTGYESGGRSALYTSVV
ncbi:hypothetical protein FRB90_011331 [Tulasnella sp. 427]|nr:hypothetical protein FRB90_011331 [Tulasnella sp. 427]